MEDLFRNYKVYIITIIVLLVLFIILGGTLYFRGNNDNKEFLHSDYVKTIATVENESGKSELPYINIKSEEIQKLNNEIAQDFYEVTSYETNQMTYEYFLNDNIISLLIKIIEIDESNVMIINKRYISYNIDLKNKNQISDSYLLQMYNTNYEKINTMIDERMKNFYNFEIENGYIDQACDYEGYLGWRNISLPATDIALVVNENNLYAYKLFELDTIFEDSEIFKEEDFIYKLS